MVTPLSRNRVNMGIVHTVLYSSFDIIIVKFNSKMEIDFKSDAINDFER